MNACCFSSSFALCSWAFATSSEPASCAVRLCMRASSVEVNKVSASMPTDERINKAPSTLPPRPLALRQTVPAGNCAAAMPV